MYHTDFEIGITRKCLVSDSDPYEYEDLSALFKWRKLGWNVVIEKISRVNKLAGALNLFDVFVTNLLKESFEHNNHCKRRRPTQYEIEPKMCKYSTLRINTKCNCCNHVKRKRISVNTFSSMNFLLFLALVICQLPTLVYGEHSNSQGETEGIHIASWNWDHVGVFITVTAFIVLSGLAKVGKIAMIVLNSTILC